MLRKKIYLQSTFSFLSLKNPEEFEGHVRLRSTDEYQVIGQCITASLWFQSREPKSLKISEKWGFSELQMVLDMV